MPKKKKPSIEKFKDFVKTHPKLRNEVKNGKYTWQELFEEWYILGSRHRDWEKYTESAPSAPAQPDSVPVPDEKNADLVGGLMNTFKNMDINQVQQYITNANQALGAIQGIIASFQGEQRQKDEEPKKQEPAGNPFAFRQD